MYHLSCIEWWDDFNCYCVVETPVADGDLDFVMHMENETFKKRPHDIVFIEWE